MNIPLNGRIAIIDDKIDQALPLINVLAQRRCPYSYYSGEMNFLPKEDEVTNDIRILFLDINLIDDKVHPDKELKSKLIPVLSRVISKENYPYVLIYWSRNEKEYRKLVEDIFENDLNDRKPIAFLSQNKLSFFELDSTKTADFDKHVKELLDEINKTLGTYKAYNHLVGWENQVHYSADKTLQEIFNIRENWSDNANYLINKLGESYAGRRIFKSQTPAGKIRSSFQAFNNVFYDTLEYSINNSTYNEDTDLEYNKDLANKDNIYTINKKLLISNENTVMEYSGSVTEDKNSKSDKAFEDLLNNVFNRSKIGADIIKDDSNKGKNNKELQKLIDKESSNKRKEIRESWRKIYFVVTPLCDFVQSKSYNVRVVKGILIKTDHLNFIDQKSEAVFISPQFKFDGDKYVIVLNFRYFFTSTGGKGIKGLKTLFRVRQQMLSEVQSKLARHVSRQGVLFLEEYQDSIF
ncbi:MAG: hypothetical protein GXC78_09865 [Chitinophagaceae bacterium]|nr:hypothetical protein [Chitinophagaceae bacterium]